jgi:ariadne-1
MECGHALCRICYKSYLEDQLKDGPEVVLSICPVNPCKLIVSDENFRILLSPIDFKKYQEYYKKSFISNNKCARYCPGPNCNNAVIYPSMKQVDIICKCGYVFCFKCMKPAHSVIACDLLAEWEAMIY